MGLLLSVGFVFACFDFVLVSALVCAMMGLVCDMSCSKCWW